MRTFVQFRKYLLEHQDLEQKLIELESDIKQKFFAQDKQISDIFKLITHMLKENEDQNQKKIGFDVSTKMWNLIILCVIALSCFRDNAIILRFTRNKNC